MDLEAGERETEQIKAAYIQYLLSLPQSSIGSFSAPAAALFAEMFVKKIRYGVTYDESMEQIMAYVASLLP